MPTDQNLTEPLKTIEIMQNIVESSIISVFRFSKPGKLCERNRVKRREFQGMVTEMGIWSDFVKDLQFPLNFTMFWVLFDCFVIRILQRLCGMTTSKPEKSHPNLLLSEIVFRSWIREPPVRSSCFGALQFSIFAVWALLSPEMDAKRILRLVKYRALVF